MKILTEATGRNLNINEEKYRSYCDWMMNNSYQFDPEIQDQLAMCESKDDITIDLVLLQIAGLVDGEDYQIGNDEFDVMIRDPEDERWKEVIEKIGE